MRFLEFYNKIQELAAVTPPDEYGFVRVDLLIEGKGNLVLNLDMEPDTPPEFPDDESPKAAAVKFEFDDYDVIEWDVVRRLPGFIGSGSLMSNDGEPRRQFSREYEYEFASSSEEQFGLEDYEHNIAAIGTAFMLYSEATAA